jgi:hypothetical protein
LKVDITTANKLYNIFDFKRGYYYEEDNGVFIGGEQWLMVTKNLRINRLKPI